jgi:hypothetical protein
VAAGIATQGVRVAVAATDGLTPQALGHPRVGVSVVTQRGNYFATFNIFNPTSHILTFPPPLIPFHNRTFGYTLVRCQCFCSTPKSES